MRELIYCVICSWAPHRHSLLCRYGSLFRPAPFSVLTRGPSNRAVVWTVSIRFCPLCSLIVCASNVLPLLHCLFYLLPRFFSHVPYKELEWHSLVQMEMSSSSGCGMIPLGQGTLSWPVAYDVSHIICLLLSLCIGSSAIHPLWEEHAVGDCLISGKLIT